MRFFSLFFLLISTTSYAEKLTVYGMGDSITAGSNVDGIGSFLQFNWVTGDALNDSFSQKFRRMGYDVTAVNIAKPGAKIADLTAQLGKIKDPSVDFFGLTIGGNDVCASSLDNPEQVVESFISKMDVFLTALESKFPSAVVTFAPVPDVAHVKRLTRDFSYCSFVWQLSGMCAKILQEEDDNVLDGYSKLVELLNQRSVEFLEQKNPKKFRMIGPHISNLFELRHISNTDCFHPSIEGQRFISDNLWQDSGYGDS